MNTAPPALSRREREVAALVADGLSNREIAERLFISERSHARMMMMMMQTTAQRMASQPSVTIAWRWTA